MPRKYTHRNRRHRGGQQPDIEMGPEPQQTYMGNVPPNPHRFEEYDRKAAQRELARRSSPAETAAFFDGPNPQQKLESEQRKMFDEDPHNKDPWSELNIFRNESRGGRRRSKKRRSSKRSNKKRYSRRSRR
jgi:hypothetical protein